MTSTGVIAKEGRTIAVDPTVIPYGTKVQIGNDPTIYIAEDTGSALRKGEKIIDIFVEEPYHEMHYSEIFIKENNNG